MKKLLLVGELDQVLGSLNEHLSGRFDTQMCTTDLEMVKGIIRIFRADMVVICLNENGNSYEQVLNLFESRYPQTPVLLIGKETECRGYTSYYESEQFDYLNRPISLGMLLRRCEEILKIYEPENSDAKAEAAENKKHILSVDDNGILLRNMKAMLEKDYNVSVANSGMMAIKQAKKNRPDLILLDYEMPEWDGKKTLEEIRNDEELKDIPVVFVTAIADKEHIAAVWALRPSGYLVKPIEQQKLYDTIEKALIQI